MRIDITSLCFGFKIQKDKDSGTPAWCTSLGQAPAGICNIKTDRPGLMPILAGMLHQSHSDFENLSATSFVLDGETIKGPTSSRERMMFSVFENVYVNGIKIEGPMIMTFEREKSASHNNRFQLCYARYLSYNGKSNAQTFKNAASVLECSENACWFVYDITIKEQNAVLLSAIVVNNEGPCEYTDSKERAQQWNLILDETLSIGGISLPIRQEIFFGAPGTGKSYKIENEILKDVPDSSKLRVTFYPDYYYSDFIGGLRPKKQGDDITYEFSAGPFAEALLKSFTEPTYLIIEEINRGNPAAIFGDIFQLLDRRDDGRSRYETTNEDLYKYLVGENADLEAVLPENKVFLPADLHILCTMNTADQNVFVLDTAFKRRFSMEYVPIDMDVFDSDPKLAPYKAEGYPAFDGTEDLAALLGETGSGITSPKRNWPTFAAFVNAKIDEINSSETKISEDKKLGPFFAGPEDFSDRKKFADKVLYYLKQDVFKYEDTILTDSYEKLYVDFAKKGKDVFSIFE